MSSFYDYSFAPKSSTSVAMDEKTEKTVMIRRIFKIDPKMQKELGHEEKPEEKAEKKEESKAEDTAIFLGGFAMDLSPRHSKTSIEDCRAKDPRYCPYHGADYMTSQLNEEFKKAGIYATGGVERLGQGKFKVQYSVPESKKGAATDIIDGFLSSPGFEEVSESDSDEVDAISKEVKMDHGNDDFAMKEEHLDTLEKDMKKGMEIDPSDLYQLRKDHYELKKLSKAAHEAMERDGINIRTKEGKEWAKSNPDWSKYREAMEKFEKDYNELRGNADLAHIKTPEDCTELMGHLEKQITQVGDFVKATDEIEALKEKKGLKGKRGIAGTTDFNNAKGKIRFAIDGLKSARKQVEEANASGDMKKMRAAAHSLELVLNQVNEGKDDIAEALKQAESYKKVLEGYPDADAGESAAPKAEEKKPEPSSEKKEESKPAEREDVAAVKKYLESRKDLDNVHAHGYADGSVVVNSDDNFKGKDVEALAKEFGEALGMNAKKEVVAGYPSDPEPGVFIRLSPKKEEPKSEKKDDEPKSEEKKDADGKDIEVPEGTPHGVKMFFINNPDKTEFKDDEGGIWRREGGKVVAPKKEEAKKEDAPKSEEKTEEKDADGMTKSIYDEMLAKWNETFHTSVAHSGEMKDLMKSAREGKIDLTPAGGGKYSNDMQFLDDIKKAVGADHPYIKKINEYIDKMKGEAKKEEPKADESKKDDHLADAMKKAKEEVDASTKEMKERSDAKYGPEAAKAYIEKLESGKAGSSHSSKSEAGVDKDRFTKRFGEDMFKRIADIADEAKKAGKDLSAITGIEDYDSSDDKRFNSLQSLVKKLGGKIFISSDKEDDSGDRTFGFTISPDKAHELYGKLDARGGLPFSYGLSV